MMRHFLILFFLILSVSLAHTADPSQLDLAQSELSSAEDAVVKMYVSHEFPSDDPKVESGVDLIGLHVQDLEETLNGTRPELKGVPLDRVKKTYAYYGLGDDRLTTKIIEAIEKGVEISIVTDLNRGLKVEFKEDEKFHSRFNEAIQAKLWNESADSRALQRLIAEGKCIVISKGVPIPMGPKCVIFSQPLYDTNKVEIIPIFHHKDFYTTIIQKDGTEKVVRRFSGTSNLNGVAPRYNRLFEMSEPVSDAYHYRYIQSVIDTFRHAGEVKDIPDTHPLVVSFKDGSKINFSFSGGQRNLSEDWEKFLQFAIESPDEMKITQILHSDFVASFTKGIEAIRQLLEIENNIDVTFIVDQKFLNDGYGLASVVAGYNGYTPYGKTILGFPKKIRVNSEGKEKTTVYAWQKGMDGAQLEDLDGAPYSVEVWHDKLGLAYYERNGKKYSVVSIGSSNFSANATNAETQMTFYLSGDSKLTKSVDDSVRLVIQKNPKFALPVRYALARDSLARVLGKTYLEIEIQEIDEVIRLINEKNFGGLREKLIQISERPTTLVKMKPSAETVSNRISRFIGFLDWINNLDKGSEVLGWVKYREFVELLRVFHFERLTTSQLKFALRGVLWGLVAGDDRKAKVEDILYQAWRAAGITHNYNNYAKTRRVVRVFDWDNTIFHMPTKIYIFHKKTGEERIVSTLEYSEIRASLGQSGDWKDYEVRTGAKTGSFREFHTNDEKFFERDLSYIIDNKLDNLNAAKYNELLQALSEPDRALDTHILTARSHSAKEMYDGIKKILVPSVFTNEIPLDNIHTIGDSSKNSSKLSQEERKLNVLKGILRSMQEKEAALEKPSRIPPLLVFADDDLLNVEKIIKALASDRKSYPLIEIVVEWVDPTQTKVHFEILADGKIVGPWDNGKNQILDLYRGVGEFTQVASEMMNCLSRVIAQSIQSLKIK